MDVRLLLVAVLGLSLAAGCSTAVRDTSATASPRPVQSAPANPDLRPQVERFYQLIESRHGNIAYTMLSDRYHKQLDASGFERQYRDLTDADVSARQSGERQVIVQLGIAATAAAPRRTVLETLTFIWDGEDWKIDAIAR